MTLGKPRHLFRFGDLRRSHVRMRHSVVGCLAALLLWACVSASPKGEILSLSPSTGMAGEASPAVLIKGRGLGDFAQVKLDDKGSARITPVTVEVGGVLATVQGRPSRDQIEARFPALPAGDYDVRVFAGSELSAELEAAFHVAAATNGVEPDPSATISTEASVPAGDAGMVTQVSSSDESDGVDETSSSEQASNTDVETTVSTSAEVTMSTVSTGDVDAAVSAEDVSSNLEPPDAGEQTTVSDEAGAAESDAGVDAGGWGNWLDECAAADGTLLFYDDYELGDFSRWTFDDNVGQDACQTTDVSDERVFEGEFALSSTLTCAPGSEAEHYAALQFAGDELLGEFDNSEEGIDAPNGVVISFDLWAELGFAATADQWVSFLLLSGSCDWTDPVLSVATPGAGEPLGISHGDEDGGTEYDYPDAPVAAQSEWSRVTVYVNYYEQVLTVWQDGVLASRAEFVRPGNTLCHVWVGAGFGADSVDSQVYEDNVMVWRLSAPLDDADTEPCLYDTNYWRRDWTSRR